MKVAIITRATINTVPGGDTVQVRETARHLQKYADVEVFTTNKKIDYNKYDIFHFFNLTRPADFVGHTKKIKAPIAITPIMVNYTEYDQLYRKGLPGFILKYLKPGSSEYLKTISRWIRGNDKLQSNDYLWMGHEKSMKYLLERSSILLSNSNSEHVEVCRFYGKEKQYAIIPNGVDPLLFNNDDSVTKERHLVICAARIEGIKNQYNLIKAINQTGYTLMLVGDPAPNQSKYYSLCRKIAGKNIIFCGSMSQQQLLHYYAMASVHVLPSWFETCGLSSMEAASMGCNIVITDKGFTREYYGDHAFYCDPADPVSILKAIENAANAARPEELKQKIRNQFTWAKAAELTFKAYQKLGSS